MAEVGLIAFGSSKPLLPKAIRHRLAMFGKQITVGGRWPNHTQSSLKFASNFHEFFTLLSVRFMHESFHHEKRPVSTS